MAVTSTPVPDVDLLTTSVKSNSFSEVHVTLGGDTLFKGSLVPGYKITASSGNSGTVVLTISAS